MEPLAQTRAALLAAGAAVVLIVSMFLEWYTIDVPERVQERAGDLPTFTGFEGLKRADVAIVVAAAIVIIVAGLVLAGLVANSPAPGIAVALVSLFALAVVLYRGIISPPGLAFFGLDLELEVSFGWFVGLVAAVVMVAAGVLVYLGGPRLELAPPEEEGAAREEQAPDGTSRPLS
jgi:hypothetical protein